MARVGKKARLPSEKTKIIEKLFKRRWNPKTKKLSNPVVTLQDVSDAIVSFNRSQPAGGKRVSTRNPANFFKDFIRNKKRANSDWSPYVLKAGYTARQVTGSGRCFEFISLPPKQTEPFPPALLPTAATPIHRIESASLPVASRRLGRAEETWIIQVAVKLRVIEAHLTLFSSRRDKIVQVDHLQISAKIGPEIDALFLAVEDGQGRPEVESEAIVSCEAKGLRDDLLEDQILQQVRALFKLKTVPQDVVIPIGIKVVGPSRLYVVEFQAVKRAEAEGLTSLSVASDAIYELTPPVPGIG